MSLHNSIMNLPCEVLIDAATIYEHSAWKKGHKQARHAAAELAAGADAEIARLREALTEFVTQHDAWTAMVDMPGGFDDPLSDACDAARAVLATTPLEAQT